MGILPEAMVNYLARLGWSHGDQEIFSREELVRHFDLAHVGAAGAVFDLAKLEWLNHHWIKRLPAAAPRRAAGALPRAGRPARSRAIAPGSRGWWTRSRSGRARWWRWPSRPRSTCARRPRTTRRPPPSSGRRAGARALRAPDRAPRGSATRLDPPALEALYRGLAAELGAQARGPRPAHAHRADRPRPRARRSSRWWAPRQRGDAGAGCAAAAAAAEARAVRRLLLARHGQSVSNAVRRFQGAQDVRAVRARRAPGGGARRGAGPAAASPPSTRARSQRARRTAEIALARCSACRSRCVDELRELSLGEWEGCTVEEIRARPGDPYARWVRDPVRVPAARRRAARRRAGARGPGRRPHRAPRIPNGDDVLVVCPRRRDQRLPRPLPRPAASSIWRLRVANCSLTEVAPPRVLSVNDTGHLRRSRRRRAAHRAAPEPPADDAPRRSSAASRCCSTASG